MPLTSTALLSIFRVVAADVPCAYEGHCRYGTSCWFCHNQQLTPDVYQTSPLPYQNLYASYPVPEAAYSHAPLDRDGNLASTKYQHNPYVNIATACLTHELETTTESQPGAEAYPLADITPNAPVIPDVPFRVRVHRFPQPECSETPAHGNCGDHDSSTTDTNFQASAKLLTEETAHVSAVYAASPSIISKYTQLSRQRSTQSALPTATSTNMWKLLTDEVPAAEDIEATDIQHTPEDHRQPECPRYLSPVDYDRPQPQRPTCTPPSRAELDILAITTPWIQQYEHELQRACNSWTSAVKKSDNVMYQPLRQLASNLASIDSSERLRVLLRTAQRCDPCIRAGWTKHCSNYHTSCRLYQHPTPLLTKFLHGNRLIHTNAAIHYKPLPNRLWTPKDAGEAPPVAATSSNAKIHSPSTKLFGPSPPPGAMIVNGKTFICHEPDTKVTPRSEPILSLQPDHHSLSDCSSQPSLESESTSTCPSARLWGDEPEGLEATASEDSDWLMDTHEASSKANGLWQAGDNTGEMNVVQDLFALSRPHTSHDKEDSSLPSKTPHQNADPTSKP